MWRGLGECRFAVTSSPWAKTATPHLRRLLSRMLSSSLSVRRDKNDRAGRALWRPSFSPPAWSSLPSCSQQQPRQKGTHPTPPIAQGLCSRRPFRFSTGGRHLLLPRFRKKPRLQMTRALLAGLLHGEGVVSVNATRWHHCRLGWEGEEFRGWRHLAFFRV